MHYNSLYPQEQPIRPHLEWGVRAIKLRPPETPDFSIWEVGAGLTPSLTSTCSCWTWNKPSLILYAQTIHGTRSKQFLSSFRLPLKIYVLKQPEGLKLVGNVESNWRSFKQQFGLYMAAIRLDSKPDARKIALLLTVAGPQAIEVFNTIEFGADADEDKEK